MKVRVNKTKIIATFGPACSDIAVMEEMVGSGVDVFRFNMSHGAHADHLDGFKKIKQINKTKMRYLTNVSIEFLKFFKL